MKRIPYGIINYNTLITESFEYVDKTMYLSKLEDVGKILLYLKPGRFGKSLFTSMMFYYYDFKSADKFDILFKDTYVFEHSTFNKNNYYCLMFDFSGISTDKKIDKNDLMTSFRKCVINGINKFNDYYGIEYDVNENDKPDNILKDFLTHFNGLYLQEKEEKRKKLYIIIDEYDNFTNAILEGNAKDFIDIVGNNGVVKSFYANIKIFVKDGIVDRFFATGICPITLNSMTTGFNIASDISTDREFNSMIGLTHDEILNLLNEYDSKTKNAIYNVMKANYDGYLFSKDLSDENRVFNATLTMYLLNYYERFHEIPEELTDKNIIVNYEKIENILKLQHNKYYAEILESCLKDGEVIGNLTREFNLRLDFNRNDIISLLYYFGYLTIRRVNLSGSITFGIPNHVMKEIYDSFFIKLLNDYDVDTSSPKLDECLNEIIKDGTINGITNYIEKVLKLIDNRMFIKFDEKYVHLLYSSLLKNDRFSVYTEYPSKGGGYVDVMLIPRDDVMKYNIMIELKYIKKGEFKKKLFEELRLEGENQLKEYSKDERLSENLKKFLVIFSYNEVKLLEEVK